VPFPLQIRLFKRIVITDTALDSRATQAVASQNRTRTSEVNGRSSRVRRTRVWRSPKSSRERHWPVHEHSSASSTSSSQAPQHRPERYFGELIGVITIRRVIVRSHEQFRAQLARCTRALVELEAELGFIAVPSILLDRDGSSGEPPWRFTTVSLEARSTTDFLTLQLNGSPRTCYWPHAHRSGVACGLREMR
jgi:hypothetical protein